MQDGFLCCLGEACQKWQSQSKRNWICSTDKCSFAEYIVKILCFAYASADLQVLGHAYNQLIYGWTCTVWRLQHVHIVNKSWITLTVSFWLSVTIRIPTSTHATTRPTASRDTMAISKCFLFRRDDLLTATMSTCQSTSDPMEKMHLERGTIQACSRLFASPGSNN